VVSGRKLAGILLESVPGAPGRIVAGIGLNVNTPQAAFPGEIASIATSLSIESGREFDIDALLERLLREFEVLRRADAADAHGRYRAHLTGVGTGVRIGETTGVFEGVDEQGRACMRQNDVVRYFTSGPLRFQE
jgi:BirA family biotin operon repressor/biotin-[acetyl-CoA-carboxylase] ligase